MMEEVRDIDNHLICYADAKKGLIEHTYLKEMISISLPVGGEVLFIKSGCYTVIRRMNSENVYVSSYHCSALGFSSG